MPERAYTCVLSPTILPVLIGIAILLSIFVVFCFGMVARETYRIFKLDKREKRLMHHWSIRKEKSSASL